MHRHDPGFLLADNAPSRMVGPWWRVCKSLGYPELDVIKYPDGEFCIIQYMNAPIIPSRTKWMPVLQKIRNVEMTASFLKHHADRLNLQYRHVWDEQAAAERRALEEVATEERRATDFSDRMFKAVRNNPDMMERIAKNGLGELNPLKMLNQIPRHKLGKGYRERI